MCIWIAQKNFRHFFKRYEIYIKKHLTHCTVAKLSCDHQCRWNMYENEQLLLYWKFAYLTRARFLLPQYGLSWVRMIIVNWALFQLYELIKISLMSLLTMKFGLIQYSILLLIYILLKDFYGSADSQLQWVPD